MNIAGLILVALGSMVLAGGAFAQPKGQASIFVEPPLPGRLSGVSFDAGETRIMLSDSEGHVQVRRVSDWLVTAQTGMVVQGPARPPYSGGGVSVISPQGDRMILVDTALREPQGWIEPTQAQAFAAGPHQNLRPSTLGQDYRLSIVDVSRDFKWLLLSYFDSPPIPAFREGETQKIRDKLPTVYVAFEIDGTRIVTAAKGRFSTINGDGDRVEIVDGAWTPAAAAEKARTDEISDLLSRLGQPGSSYNGKCVFGPNDRIRHLLVTANGQLAIDGRDGLRRIDLTARFGVSSKDFGDSSIISLGCSRAGKASWLLYRRPADGVKNELWGTSTLHVLRIDQQTGEITELAGHTGFSYEADEVGPQDSLLISYDTRAFFYNAAGAVRAFTPSGGAVRALSFDATSGRLVVAPQTEYSTGGEYTPWWSKGRMRILDFKEGGQTWFGPESDCTPTGGLIPVCESVPGQLSHWIREVKQVSSGRQLRIDDALSGRKFQYQDSGDSPIVGSYDGKQAIVRLDEPKPAASSAPPAMSTMAIVDLEKSAAFLVSYSRDYLSFGNDLEPEFSFLFSDDLSRHVKFATGYGKPRTATLVDTRSAKDLATWTYAQNDQDPGVVAFSHDGRHIAYLAYREKGSDELVVTGPDGSGAKVLQLGAGSGGFRLSWSLDSAALYTAKAAEHGFAEVKRLAANGLSITREVRLPIDGAITAIEALSNERVAIGTDLGAVHIFNFASGKEQVRYYALGDGEWVALTPEGYFNSSSTKAEKLLRVGLNGRVTELGQYRERFYRPDIVQMAMNGQPLPSNLASVALSRPVPQVALQQPPARASASSVKLNFTITDAGGGVGGLRVLLNDSAIVEQGAGVAKAGQQTMDLKLVPGDNRIQIVAFNADRSVASSPAETRVTYTPATREGSTLHVLAIGIEQFKNPILKLTYPSADAKALGEALSAGGKGLFDSVQVTTLTKPEETTRAALLETFKRYEAIAPNDAFVLYVASHGSVEGGDLNDREFMLYTSNVGLLSTEALRRDAIGQADLKTFIANVPATRKLILLDTCHAGSVGDSLAAQTRGIEEAGAIKILSHATGTTILAASMAQQQAIEGYKGHGLFTWTLLQALQGEAALPGTRVVSNWNITSYVGRMVPDLAEKVFHRDQYPTVNDAGRQFDLVRVTR